MKMNVYTYGIDSGIFLFVIFSIGDVFTLITLSVFVGSFCISAIPLWFWRRLIALTFVSLATLFWTMFFSFVNREHCLSLLNSQVCIHLWTVLPRSLLVDIPLTDLPVLQGSITSAVTCVCLSFSIEMIGRKIIHNRTQAAFTFTEAVCQNGSIVVFKHSVVKHPCMLLAKFLHWILKRAYLWWCYVAVLCYGWLPETFEQSRLEYPLWTCGMGLVMTFYSRKPYYASQASSLNFACTVHLKENLAL